MNVLTRRVLNVARSFIGNSTEVNKFHVAGHYGNTGIQVFTGGLVNNMRASLGNMLQELNESRLSLRKNRAKVRRDITRTGVLKIAFEQIRWKSSLQQLHKRGLKDKKVKKSKNPLSGKPFAKGIILRTVIKKPKKPNSANRKCVIVKLSTGKEMTAYVPGIGHNLQEHNVVLCRAGRLQDTPGVKIKCVRGKYDLPHKGVSPSSALNRGKERCYAKTGSMQISKSLLAKLTAGGPKINRKVITEANSRVAARSPKRPQVRYKMSIISVINHVATGKETTSLMGCRKNEDRGTRKECLKNERVERALLNELLDLERRDVLLRLGKSSTVNFTFSLTPRYCVKFKKVPDNGSLSVSETFDKSCGTSRRIGPTDIGPLRRFITILFRKILSFVIFTYIERRKTKKSQEMEIKMEDSANETKPLDFRNYLSSFEGKKDSSPIHQPLDFRSCLSLRKCLKEESPLEEKEPVLDLSCKKILILPSSSENDVREGKQKMLESSTDAKLSANVKSHSRTDSKSPFEGRSFMVTPPSESDSPKKIKFEEDAESASTVTNNVEGYSLLPINVPTVPSILPTLLTVNSDGTKEKICAKIQSPTTTTPTISTNVLSADAPRKIPRPFKAYPLTLTVSTPDMIYNQNSNETYSEFRSRMLENVRRQNETTNLKMRRSNKNTTVLPTSTVDEKDAAYWERRKKNNEAAKRSRDARRAKEDEIAIRAAFLEQENIKLKYELAALKNETAKLKCMIYST
ncbi:hypothetical protein HZH66_010999 [Vespula vulgaris]|uniref:Small ribosomal subunit protein uS12m n=2 Tax=Vespula vulgaris TaxID=7454 RepID=A0A834MWZ0_VESVU|nr:hypothetical protein HZH66_010999 [Vespula vulgaris]